jgi:hypothetical protein
MMQYRNVLRRRDIFGCLAALWPYSHNDWNATFPEKPRFCTFQVFLLEEISLSFA